MRIFGQDTFKLPSFREECEHFIPCVGLEWLYDLVLTVVARGVPESERIPRDIREPVETLRIGKIWYNGVRTGPPAEFAVIVPHHSGQA